MIIFDTIKFVRNLLFAHLTIMVGKMRIIWPRSFLELPLHNINTSLLITHKSSKSNVPIIWCSFSSSSTSKSTALKKLSTSLSPDEIGYFNYFNVFKLFLLLLFLIHCWIGFVSILSFILFFFFFFKHNNNVSHNYSCNNSNKWYFLDHFLNGSRQLL